MRQLSNTEVRGGSDIAEPSHDSDRRITTLDGLRGLMTLMVIISHYFGEVGHGLRPLMFGWIAVNMFFVLSGFLIGRLILTKRDCANFFTVFYVRRVCRIIPAYMITVLVLAALIHIIDRPWMDADLQFPLWSYLTFSQGISMVMTGSIGAHWLAPTWTLGVEEHFYLIVPATIVFTPRRWLVPLLLAAAAATFGLRVAVFMFGISNGMLARAILPGCADVLACGLLAAIAMRNPGIAWRRLVPALRVTPIVALFAVFAIRIWNEDLFSVFAPLLLAIGSAAFLLCIVLETPEARRFQSKTLQFFGNNGYCLYLTHLPVLGLVHGIVLGSKPDLASPAQWLVTMAALPVCVVVGWGMTKLIEEPLSRFGRRWRWDSRRRRSVWIDAPRASYST